MPVARGVQPAYLVAVLLLQSVLLNSISSLRALLLHHGLRPFRRAALLLHRRFLVHGRAARPREIERTHPPHAPTTSLTLPTRSTSAPARQGRDL